MKSRELSKLGIPKGEAMRRATKAIALMQKAGLKAAEIRKQIRRLTKGPQRFTHHEHLGGLAQIMLDIVDQRAATALEKPVIYHQWGTDIEEGAIRQMNNACRLPISIKGALMADAHQGYGLPIGGVLATNGAVIPYAVGMDIACRMHLSVLDLPLSTLTDNQERLKKAIANETRFGVGTAFKKKRQHPVMDHDWSFSSFVQSQKDKAWGQLGTSGSGNHFVEFGTLTLERSELGLEAGVYTALLSHSGSRGTGALIAQHYSKIARQRHPELPRELTHLAWLDLDSDEGMEYWLAMNLMGNYAAANHELIHRHIHASLGLEPLVELENHHNFAWKEIINGRELIVHRKGATPAGQEDLGIIPGSMATPGYVVRGRGNNNSLNSASHGAGRKMSRKAALKIFSWKDIRATMKQKGITLISAGLDEVPMAYKDINEVMGAQSDLVEIIARFDPKLVKMSGPNR